MVTLMSPESVEPMIKVECLSDPLGYWSVELPPLKASFDLTMGIEDGKSKIAYRDINIGEVLLTWNLYRCLTMR